MYTSNIYASNVYSSNITCCNLTSSNITSSNLTLSDQTGSSGLITLSNGLINLGGNIVGLNMPGTIYFTPYTITPCNKLVFFERGNSILFYSGIDLIDLNGSVRYTVTSSSVPVFGYHTFGITTFATYYEWMRITGTDTGNNNTKVGIANNNPAYTLDVGGDINCSGAFRINGVALTTGGITNIGGTIDCSKSPFPNGSLSNVDSIYFTPYTVGKKLIFFVNSGNMGFASGIELYDTSGSIKYAVTQLASVYGFHTFGISFGAYWEWMRITGTENIATTKVGIACNSPEYMLDVGGDINCRGSLRVNGNSIYRSGSLSNIGTIYFTPYTIGNKIRLYQGLDARFYSGIDVYDVNGSIKYCTTYATGGYGVHSFGITVLGSYYEWLRFTGNDQGNANTKVGIANSSPTYTLDVGGDINCSGTFRINGVAITTGGGGGGGGTPILLNNGIINAGAGSLSNVASIYATNSVSVAGSVTIYGGLYMNGASGASQINMLGNDLVNGGNIYATYFYGTVIAPSDSNIKTNIQDARNYIDDISKLRIITFDYLSNYGGSNNIGLIAQEVREIFPEIVGSNDGILNINYNGLTSIILSGVQVTQSSLIGYKTALESLEDKYQKQQAQIDFLLSTVSKLTKV